MIYVFLGIGILLLWFGSEAVQRGGVSLFRALGLPRIFTSLFVVSLAMSLPVLAVCLQATLQARPDIALGDVVGSSLANLLLVFGLGAVTAPMPAPPRTVFRDGGVLIATCLLFVGSLLSGGVTPLIGVILLAAWLAYLA